MSVRPKDGCKHKKSSDHCIWCYECGAKIAGPKPEKTMKVGWYVIPKDGDEGCLGTIGAVKIDLLGLATLTPCWSESVVIVGVNGQSWSGPADRVTRLVAFPSRSYFDRMEAIVRKLAKANALSKFSTYTELSEEAKKLLEEDY